MFEQIYTLRSIHYKGEYEIDNIVASVFGLRYLDSKFQTHKDAFKEIIHGADVIQHLREFFTLITHNDLYHNKRITSGVYMCAFAIALGYTEIYLAGIDLYSTGSTYAFNTHQPNLLKIVPQTLVSEVHSLETDLGALELLAKHYGAKFYSLCPSSPISKHIPLAPVRADSSPQDWEQVKKSKPKDATRDMLIPPTSAYKRFYYGSADAPFNPLRQNILYRLVRDILRFPSQTKHYIRAKKRYK